jgi:hypothetical protein
MLAKSLAVAWGILVWYAISTIGHRAEAWDAPQYWSIGFPALLLGGAILGALHGPPKAWQIGFWIGLGQGIALLATGLQHGSSFNLWPLTIVAVLIISLPCVLAAFLGGYARRLWTSSAQ